MKILALALAASGGVFALGALTPVEKLLDSKSDHVTEKVTQEPSTSEWQTPENFNRDRYMKWAETQKLNKDDGVLEDINDPRVKPFRVNAAIVNESHTVAIIMNLTKVGDPGNYQAYLRTYMWVERPANRPITVKIHPLYRLQGEHIEVAMDHVNDTLTLFGPLEPEVHKNIFVVPDDEMPKDMADIQQRFLDPLDYSQVVRYAAINY